VLLNIAIGVALVVLMSLLARTEHSWLNGLIPLFPLFALIGQTTTWLSRGNAAAQDVAFIGFFALIPYFAYLAMVYFFAETLGFPRAAAIGVALWAAIAGVIVYLRVG
jgi:membrane protein GlpM